MLFCLSYCIFILLTSFQHLLWADAKADDDLRFYINYTRQHILVYLLSFRFNKLDRYGYLEFMVQLGIPTGIY